MPIPKLLISLAVSAASMAMTAMRKIEGPRLDDLKFTSGDYGSPLAMVWGKRRLQCPIFWAEDLKEVKQQRKTKGGKYNEYTYFGTFAVALAGHEISGVTRVWFDTHLVFDLTGAGPVTPFDFGDGSAKMAGALGALRETAAGTPFSRIPALGGKGTSYFAIYPGTEIQEPDPRMMATVEDKHGEGSCPAYRGTAYIVFKDIPLEKIGNRIPQVSVEMVTASDATYPYSTTASAWSYQTNVLISADAALLHIGANMSFGAPFTLVDVAARAVIIDGAQPAEIKAMDPYGTLWALDGSDSILGLDYDGAVSVSSGSLTRPVGGAAWLVDLFAFAYNERYWVGAVPVFNRSELYTLSGGAPTSQSIDDLTGSGWGPTFFFQDADGDVWACGKGGGTVTTLHMLNVTGGGYFQVTGLASTSNDPVGRHYQDADHDHFLIAWGGDLLIIDRPTQALTDTVTSFGDSPYRAWKNGRPSDPSWYQHESGGQFAEYSAIDGSLIRVMSLTTWAAGTELGGIYDVINHAWIGLMNDGSLRWHYLDRIVGDGVPLSQICGDVADRVDVQDYSFTALDQIVTGWSATQGQGSNMLEPLFDAYASDIAPHDFTIRGVKRTGVTTGTLATARFAKDQGPRYTLRVRQASELPRALVYNFADTDGDQQPNNVRVSRPLDATDASDERTIDLTTFASDPDTMRGLADRHFRYLWNSRKEASFGLTFQQLAIAPGDVKTPTFDDETFTARCVKTVIRANGVMATEWVYDNPSLALTDGASGAPFDGRNPSVIIIPLLSKGFALDIPLLRDADNSVNPVLYTLAAPYAVGAWPGAIIYQSIDGEYSDEVTSVASSAPAAWGHVTEVLPYANPNLWDRGSSITVTLQTGSLTGTTEAAIDANPLTGLAAIGGPGRWEIVNIVNAVLIGTNTYTVSGFKRGRRGTEWAAELHAAGDQFVLLETAEDAEMGLSEVGTDLSFKAVTNGRTASGALAVNVTPYTGASLKPYAPCHLEAFKEANGDWTLTWVRRTRVGGAWTSGTSIPLSEASEEYELTVGDGVSDDTKAVMSAATYLWTVAEQTTDTGAEVMAGDLVWSVAQVSDAVGAGFLAEATA